MLSCVAPILKDVPSGSALLDHPYDRRNHTGRDDRTEALVQEPDRPRRGVSVNPASWFIELGWTVCGLYFVKKIRICCAEHWRLSYSPSSDRCPCHVGAGTAPRAHRDDLMNTKTTIIVAGALSLAGVAQGAVERSGSAADAAGLAGVVDDFRDDLGTLNANEPGSRGSGRRQINWDAAPDAVSAPNPFPGDFFNADFNPRARGITFETPGTGFQLSATAASGAGERFGNIGGADPDSFGVFSQERLFTPINSNITEVSFFIPGTNTPATTTGFGAVFSDVDRDDSTWIEYFDVDGESLGRFFAAAGPTADRSLSFVGVSFDEAIVASVTIQSGNTAIGAFELNTNDVVVMDDFIFGEPVPTPGAAVVLAGAAISTLRRRR